MEVVITKKMTLLSSEGSEALQFIKDDTGLRKYLMESGSAFHDISLVVRKDVTLNAYSDQDMEEL